MIKSELLKRLKKYPDHFEVVIVGRVEDELLPVEHVQKTKDDQIILKG